jgi:hypothetical protein
VLVKNLVLLRVSTRNHHSLHAALHEVHDSHLPTHSYRCAEISGRPTRRRGLRPDDQQDRCPFADWLLCGENSKQCTREGRPEVGSGACLWMLPTSI